MPLPKNSALHCADCAALARLARQGLVRMLPCDACGGAGSMRFASADDIQRARTLVTEASEHCKRVGAALGIESSEYEAALAAYEDAVRGYARLGVERHCGVCHGTGVLSDPPAHTALRDARNAGIVTVYR